MQIKGRVRDVILFLQNQGNELSPARIGFDGCRKIIEKVCIQVNKAMMLVCSRKRLMMSGL